MPQSNDDDDLDGVPRVLDEIQLQPQALATLHETHAHSTAHENSYNFTNTQLVINSVTSETSTTGTLTADQNSASERHTAISFLQNKISQSDDLPDYLNVIAAKRLQDPAAYISPEQQAAGFGVQYNYPRIHAPMNANNAQKHNSSNKYIFEGLFGCIKPLFGIWGAKGVHRNATSGSEATENGNSFANQNFDNFEIDFERIKDMQYIDSGAQGSVYKAALEDQVIAVKKLKSKEDAKVKVLRQLNHPNLVLVKNVSVCREGFFYLIMEYCTNGVLYKHLKKARESGSGLPPAKMLKWAQEVAGGMQYLHSKKLIHCDLKSPNILIGDNQQMKITDFGQCKNLSSIGKNTSNALAGTVAWMAPEIIRNQQWSEKVDIWSFGVVLWELVTCEVPYENIEPNTIIYGVGNNTLHLRIPDKLPDGIKILLKICWDNKPMHRPSFSQIIKHLDIAAKNEQLLQNDKDYFSEQREWRKEITQDAALQKTQLGLDTKLGLDLVEKRDEELRHANLLREMYEKKMATANNLYLELNCMIVQLNDREKVICKREKQLNIVPKRRVPALLKREFEGSEKRNKNAKNQQNTKAPSIEKTAMKDAQIQTDDIAKFIEIKVEEKVQYKPKREALTLEIQSKNRIVNKEADHTLSPSSVKFFEREYSRSYKSSNNNLSDSSCSLRDDDEDDSFQRHQARGSKRSMKSTNSCNAIRNQNDSSRTFSPPSRRKPTTSFNNVNSLRSSKRSFSSRNGKTNGNASSENDEPEEREYRDIIDDDVNRKKYEQFENRFSLNYSSEGGVVSDEGNTSERPQSSLTLSSEETAEPEAELKSPIDPAKMQMSIDELNKKLQGELNSSDLANCGFLSEIAESTRI